MANSPHYLKDRNEAVKIHFTEAIKAQSSSVVKLLASLA